ncbi:MAG: hypothetical protein U0797_29210 [Gemmataceae bacterium]
MADVRRFGSLEVGQDLQFQRYQWAAQRWGWLALLLVLLAALLGLLGSGPLSGAVAQAGDGSVRVEFERFLRREAPAALHFAVGSDGLVRLWIDREYLRRVRVLEVTPRPEREEVGSDAVTYVFRLSGPGEVTLRFEPVRIGYLPGWAGLAGGPAVSFAQFAYP